MGNNWGEISTQRVKRKQATAKVWIQSGSGNVTVNKKET